MSNADNIRAMTDEELAQWIANVTANTICLTMEHMGVKSNKLPDLVLPADAWFDWLREEADT